jgi:hypothetical protein
VAAALAAKDAKIAELEQAVADAEAKATAAAQALDAETARLKSATS